MGSGPSLGGGGVRKSPTPSKVLSFSWTLLLDPIMVNSAKSSDGSRNFGK